MGWHKIDPQTGEPAKDAHSALSREPDFVLLNAVPGVDDNQGDCYLGDSPWDMASTVPSEIAAVAGDAWKLSDEQIRDLLLRRIVPAGVNAESGGKLLQVADALWRDIDSCYEDDWERPARPAEQRWICENVLAHRPGRS